MEAEPFAGIVGQRCELDGAILLDGDPVVLQLKRYWHRHGDRGGLVPHILLATTRQSTTKNEPCGSTHRRPPCFLDLPLILRVAAIEMRQIILDGRSRHAVICCFTHTFWGRPSFL